VYQVYHGEVLVKYRCQLINHWTCNCRVRVESVRDDVRREAMWE
jgi:hypothetical protein